MNDCPIEGCVRDISERFCNKHELAYENIEENFKKWQNAYNEDDDEYEYDQYLQRLATDPDIGAGIWVTEVATHLIANQ